MRAQLIIYISEYLEESSEFQHFLDLHKAFKLKVSFTQSNRRTRADHMVYPKQKQLLLLWNSVFHFFFSRHGALHEESDKKVPLLLLALQTGAAFDVAPVRNSCVAKT